MSVMSRPTGVARELRIDLRQDEDGCVVTVTTHSESDTRSFALRVDQAQVDAALGSTGDIRKPSIRRSGSVSSIDPAQDVGRRLFEGVFGGRLGRIYQREAATALADSAPMILRVATEDLDLARLPWELFYDFLVRQDFIVLCREWTVVREHPAQRHVDPGPAARSMLVVSSDTPPGTSIGIELELYEQLFDQVRHLHNPTRDELAEAVLSDEHTVLHFIGTADERAPAPRLVISANEREWVDAEQLSAWLAETERMRLVFLNACDSDRIACMAARNVPAAIGMQGMILDRACVSFAHAVYPDLLDGATLGTAVADGRKQLDYENPGTRQWAMPVLYVPPVDVPLFAPEREETKVVRKLPPVIPAPISPDARRIEIRLELATRNLAALEETGEGAPLFVIQQIEQTRAEVAQLRTQLEQAELGHAR